MNKKDKIQLAVTGVLVVILAVILVLGMGKKGKKNKRRSSSSRAGVSASTAKPKSPKASPSVKLSPFRQLQEEARTMPLVRDPFTLKPIEKEEGEEDAKEVKFYLIGIAWDPVQPKAIINNKIVQIGSQLGLYTVMEILEEKVILSDGAEKLELLLEL